MKTTKTYLLRWLDDQGEIHNLGTITTSNPVQALFQEVCKMIAGTSFFFDPKNDDKIIKSIKRGKTKREHYFYEANYHALSLIEKQPHS